MTRNAIQTSRESSSENPANQNWLSKNPSSAAADPPRTDRSLPA